MAMTQTKSQIETTMTNLAFRSPGFGILLIFVLFIARATDAVNVNQNIVNLNLGLGLAEQVNKIPGFDGELKSKHHAG